MSNALQTAKALLQGIYGRAREASRGVTCGAVTTFLMVISAPCGCCGANADALGDPAER